MKHGGRWLAGIGITACSLNACGQELVMPPRKDVAESEAAGAANGLTGLGGAASDGPAAKLPVLDEPVFTTFGGADANEPAHRGGAGSTSRGGSSAAGGSEARAGSRAAPEPSAGEGGAAGASASAVPPEPSARLLLSEYIEGSHSFKALEIVALEGGSLERCELLTYFNGKTEPSALALHGSLTDGEVQVLCSNGDEGLAAAYPDVCDVPVYLRFNGDDALALACDGMIQDIFGQIGVDPGESWGAGATLDHTLQRRCNITAGCTDPVRPFDIAAEWIVAPQDTFTDLRQRACDAP